MTKQSSNPPASDSAAATPPSKSAHAVFEARGITKVYHVGEVDVHALRGVDVDLYEGEFVVLLGPSGSGKSTLLNILGGLDVPTSGHVRYFDHDLTEDEATVLEISQENYPVIKRGKGCERCGSTGYRGRIGLYELLLMSDAIRHHIASGADANIIRQQAIEEGMRTLRQDALEKLKAGVTTPEEVVRVTKAL